MLRQNKNNYKPTLIHLMSFVDNVAHKKDKEFTQEQLTLLTPGNIERWMKLQAYGTPDPGPEATQLIVALHLWSTGRKLYQATCLID
jgi:hypothetical protein